MNTTEQKQVLLLRRQGLGYKRIAAQLGLPLNTVKSFCNRHADSTKAGVCLQCGTAVTQPVGRKEKRFCSDACRMAWWKAHPTLVDRKAFYSLTCAFCGSPFESYGNSRRKYCCRACYGKARTKGAQA